MADLDDVAARVNAIRRRFVARDRRAQEVRAVRHGDFDQVAPDLFSDEWPRPVVANRIDVMAKHAAAALAPLPIISCQSTTTTSDRARDFADKRTKIANHYASFADLQEQMQQGADQFYTYGLIVTSIYPDMEHKMPVPIMEDSIGVYPVWDRLGRTIEVAQVYDRSAIELCAEFPDAEPAIRRALNLFALDPVPDTRLEVTCYSSATRTAVYLSQHSNIALLDMPNPLGKCPYVVTKKPGLDSEIQGAFDDLIWVQLALHAFQTITLSAAAQAVEAPLAVPTDVIDVPTGPGAVIRTNNPRDVHRVDLPLPTSAFGVAKYLADDLAYGAISPEALGGSIDASVVTGKGVQQLMAGYSQQIAMCQTSLASHFRKVLELCFEMDEKFWPAETKSIKGLVKTAKYAITYRPDRDIAGDYTIDIQYGGIAGLDPNRALVALLQALGGDLVSKDHVRRNLPWALDPADEENKITVEKLRGSLMESLAGYVQSLPAMVAQGQDASAIITGVITTLEMVQKGEPLERALRKVFPEPEQQPAAAVPGAEGSTPPGFGPDGLPTALTPGVASRGPGARPDMSMLFAGNTASGAPNLQAGVSRMIPAGGGV